MNQNYIVKKAFRKYLLFSVLAAIAAPLGMIVDGIVMGNFLGEEAMAAAGLVSPLFILLSAFSGIIASGSISLCGKYIGQEQPKKVNQIFSTAMLWSGVLYLGCLAACLFAPRQLAGLLGADDTLLPLTAAYIRGLGVGVGFNILHLALVEFTKLDGSPALGPISIAVMTIVNIALDLCAIFWFKNGILGIALATSISYLSAVLVCLTHFLRPISTLKFVKIQAPLGTLLELCKHGLPRAGNGICFAITTALMNYRLAFFGGSVALAAFSIQSSIGLFVGATCLGVGSTTLLLSGIFFGEEDKETLETALKVSLREGFCITALVCGLCFIFMKPMLSVFGALPPAVMEMTYVAVACTLMALVVFTINHVFVNYYQGTSNLKMANFVSIIEALPAKAFYILLLPTFMGINGLWIATVFGGFTTSLTLMLFIFFQTKTFPKNTRDYLLLDKSFGAEPDMGLNISISNTLEEVVSVSKMVYDFCEHLGIDNKRKHHLSLCVEEMAGNVVQYGFSNEKPHTLDIRIVKKEEQLIFRLRDDGMPFNPLSSAWEDEADLSKNVGIRLVQGLATSMEYRYTVGLNNLLIKL